MSAFYLRPAEDKDRAAIRTLVRNGQINPTGLDWRRFLVASTAEGEVIGCGQIKPHRDGSCELASIVTKPSWQGQGIASAIIERLLADQSLPIYLTCQDRLEMFYQRFGFQAITDPAQIPTYFRLVSNFVNALYQLGITSARLLVMYWAPTHRKTMD